MRQLLVTVRLGLRAPRFWGVLIVWAISLLYLLFQGGKTAFMLFAIVTLLLLYLLIGGAAGMKQVRGRRRLFTEEERSELLQAGDKVKIRLDFNVPGFLPMPYIIIREVMRRHNGESWSFEESVIPGLRGKGELVFQTPPLERGRYSFADTECASEDIFGFIEHRTTFRVPGQFRVLPRIVFIPRWHLINRNSRLPGPQTAVLKSRRETTQINGVRDYVYGDRISRVHWNATAKTGKWKSKEFEYDSVPKTLLVLDATAVNYKSSAQFELAVSAAASMLEYAKGERISIGLVTLGKQLKIFSPSDNFGDRERMMHHLVDISSDGEGPMLPKLETAGKAVAGGSYFVLISPLSGQPVLDTLRWADTRGMIPSHVLIAKDKSKQQAAWTTMLNSRGIHGCHITALHELPAALGGSKG